MSFFLTPELWMLLLIVGAVFIYGDGTRLALIGVVCYALSYVFSSAYKIASDGLPGASPVELLFWQGGLLAVLTMYGIVARSWWLPAAGLAMILVQFAGINRHPLETAVTLLIACAVLLIYLRISYDDLLPKLVWGIVLIAESWSLAEKAVCPIVPHPFEGVSQCARAFGPIAPHLDTIATTLLLIWIGARWKFRKTV